MANKNIEYVFWFIFIINLCRQFFAISERKVLDQNVTYIDTFQTILRNVCLSVARLQPTPAYVEA